MQKIKKKSFLIFFVIFQKKGLIIKNFAHIDTILIDTHSTDLSYRYSDYNLLQSKWRALQLVRVVRERSPYNLGELPWPRCHSVCKYKLDIYRISKNFSSSQKKLTMPISRLAMFLLEFWLPLLDKLLLAASLWGDFDFLLSFCAPIDALLDVLLLSKCLDARIFLWGG